ncbi:MAG TPA: class I SAM-dependent methyltransferase [Chloroflexota bacterium]
MDPYHNIAALYDWEHEEFKDDVAFYLSMAQNGPVLEVGCGTGRIMVPLLAAGLEVWGIEPSPSMFEHARRKVGDSPHAHLLLGELGGLSLERRFATVLMPLNLLWHFPDDASVLSALREAGALMAPGATLLVDVSNPLTLADRGANGEVRLRLNRSLGDDVVSSFSAAWDDAAEQQLRLLLWYDIASASGNLKRVQTELRLRYMYRSQLELLMRRAGFSVDAVYGSYDLDPYDSDASNLLVIASRAY